MLGVAGWPVDRVDGTRLTTGMLAFLVEARGRKARVETPKLEVEHSVRPGQVLPASRGPVGLHSGNELDRVAIRARHCPVASVAWSRRRVTRPVGMLGGRARPVERWCGPVGAAGGTGPQPMEDKELPALRAVPHSRRGPPPGLRAESAVQFGLLTNSAISIVRSLSEIRWRFCKQPIASPDSPIRRLKAPGPRPRSHAERLGVR